MFNDVSLSLSSKDFIVHVIFSEFGYVEVEIIAQFL